MMPSVFMGLPWRCPAAAEPMLTGPLNWVKPDS